jgi:glyoxylase-like metal-dependent hydrolase (beta-lactamase superfamily II)
MILARYTVGPFAENCYVIGSGDSVAIVDPGAESDRIAADLEAHGWRPEAILLTHGHIDHIAHVGHLCERYGLPVWAPAEDQFLLDSPQIPQLAAMLGWWRSGRKVKNPSGQQQSVCQSSAPCR